MIILRSIRLLLMISWFGLLELLNKPLFGHRESKTRIRHDLKEWNNRIPQTSPDRLRWNRLRPQNQRDLSRNKITWLKNSTRSLSSRPEVYQPTIIKKTFLYLPLPLPLPWLFSPVRSFSAFFPDVEKDRTASTWRNPSCLYSSR